MEKEELATERLSYSISEACRLTSLGRTLVYELIGSGRLETKKIGRRTLITAHSLHALVGCEERS